ncbi:MAG: phospho-N-acetylmuramoyl-pentapeptide-transferase [Candidatus Staskawiczbacteria bacterium]|nr:phospho-N-acetylmuramoyl-pentapeptide-transferase [Candidatus Staskawiczbacteria bacterium]
MKYGRKKTREFLDFHSSKNGTPTMGGIIIWLTVLIVIFVTFFLAKIFPNTFSKFNFLTRPQTYLPVGTLIFAALLGLFDDILVNLEKKLLRVRSKLVIFSLAGLVGGYETDGLDGLLGGVMAMVFFMYTIITFALGKNELAIFCATIVGALIAFLWFNVYPARFFMGDTGSVMLGITAGTIAMLTNTVLLLPFFMFIPVVETLSVIIQIASIKLRAGKKVFLFTPIHHHFEKLGWPETQITMRFWIINGVVSAIGLLLFVLDRHL